ncbi:hypothetical protein [Falsiroseomonas sp. CW058]|uniref:hypothetical protein n=1 Tax=Falsiroseomonas sp. CW058 TaxID=3388664 RepID=UPI003D314FF6
MGEARVTRHPTPGAFLAGVVDPGLDWVRLHTGISSGRAAARRFLLAVAIQETGLAARAQAVAGDAARAGPARGWWQFEAPTIGLLLRHPASSQPLRAMCAAAWVRPEPDDIWRAIEGHDLLALGVARLLLLTDPFDIPADEAAAWQCYAARLWRPGKPHPDRWPAAWRAAVAATVPY